VLKINDCISYIQKIEEAYPDWTALTILDNLRFDSYNSSFFQKMLGTDSSKRVEPKGNLTLQQRDDLYDSIQHGADINDKSKESGISLDPSTNRMVAFGHVIVGIAAGVRHPLPAYKVTIPGFGIFKDRVTYITKVFSLRKMIREPIGIDSLYALTITGDIGQTATSKHTLCRDSCMWGGVGSDASSAELHGDIDGFLIGYWLCSTKEGQIFRKKMYDEKNTYNLSTLLGVYYRTKQNTYLSGVMRSPMSNQPLEAIRRFTNMSAELKDPKHRTIFIGQSMAFNNWYSSVLLRIFPDSSKTLIALADFKKWCDGNGVVKNFGAANDNVTNLLRGTEAFMVSQNLATFIDEPIATSLDEEPEELIASWDTNSDVFNA
jgi:hypothetical protein